MRGAACCAGCDLRTQAGIVNPLRVRCTGCAARAGGAAASRLWGAGRSCAASRLRWRSYTAGAGGVAIFENNIRGYCFFSVTLILLGMEDKKTPEIRHLGRNGMGLKFGTDLIQ